MATSPSDLTRTILDPPPPARVGPPAVPLDTDHRKEIPRVARPLYSVSDGRSPGLAALALPACTGRDRRFACWRHARRRRTSLAGVTITFGDQLKEYQTIFAATNALKGAAYTVNWTNFVGGPPVIAAEIGGSVDLGDMAETPTIFAQSAGDPVKVVAATEGANPKVSPYDIVVPTGSPIKTRRPAQGPLGRRCRRARSSSTSSSRRWPRRTFPTARSHRSTCAVTDRVHRGDQRPGRRRGHLQPLTGLDLATGKVQRPRHGRRAAADARLPDGEHRRACRIRRRRRRSRTSSTRFYKASRGAGRRNPSLAAETYAKTYGVSWPWPRKRWPRRSPWAHPSPRPSSATSRTRRTRSRSSASFPSTLNVKEIFDLPFNKTVMQAPGSPHDLGDPRHRWRDAPGCRDGRHRHSRSEQRGWVPPDSGWC